MLSKINPIVMTKTTKIFRFVSKVGEYELYPFFSNALPPVTFASLDKKLSIFT